MFGESELMDNEMPPRRRMGDNEVEPPPPDYHFGLALFSFIFFFPTGYFAYKLSRMAIDYYAEKQFDDAYKCARYSEKVAKFTFICGIVVSIIIFIYGSYLEE